MGRRRENKMARKVSMEEIENWERAAQAGEDSETGREQAARTAEDSEAGREQKARTAEGFEAGREQAARTAEGSEAGREQAARTAEGSEAGREQKTRAEGFERRRSRKGRREKGRRLTGSMAAKTVAFCTLTVSSFIGILSAVVCFYMGMAGYYTSSLDAMLVKELRPMMQPICYEVRDCLSYGDVDTAAELCRNKNLDIELYYYGAQIRQVIWSTWNGYDTGIVTDTSCVFSLRADGVRIGGHTLKKSYEYWFRIYMDPAFPKEDEFQDLAMLVTWGYDCRYLLIAVAAGCVLLCGACFIFLLCGAGHRNDREGIVPSVLTYVPLDLLTALFGGALFFLGTAVYALMEEVYYHGLAAVGAAAAGTVMAVLAAFYLMDLALRLKRERWWKNSLICMVLRGLRKLSQLVFRGIRALLRTFPMVPLTLLVFLGICILEFVGMLIFVREQEAILLWGLEKLILLFIVMYIALTCKKLLTASRALAEGQESYQVDTSRMFGNFREHGENLNSLGRGISRAVAERMKSEHLKTELITNVSHDIKTPLTSIINYADLICEEAFGSRTEEPHMGQKVFSASESGERADMPTDGGDGPEGTGPAAQREDRIREYAEVLLRQSRRLKKLLEDLVEASKATTGNLEVELKACEVGVLLSQAVGEYQQRMEEKELELIARQPDQPVMIMADGRHLWRVFDNLLNNICKYAQEKSRVYLSVEIREGQVLIIFRNMSKYPLDISGEELEERFVRGDRSRHMEGNGLGLSIAKSLIDLQGGKMEIVIDGDLFKVILSFDVCMDA